MVTIRAAHLLAAVLLSTLPLIPQAASEGTGSPTLIGPPASAAPAEDGQWTMPAKNYASTRYSGLDEINAETVGQLQVAFTFSTGLLRGHEGAPIVGLALFRNLPRTVLFGVTVEL